MTLSEFHRTLAGTNRLSTIPRSHYRGQTSARAVCCPGGDCAVFQRPPSGIAMPSPLSLSAAAVASGPDNRYCAAPRTPQFGATADGPATLPTKCINTALSSTPSPGATWSVCASGCAYTKLQDALDAAACGDTIQMRAGETFSSGKITFPARNCDDAHWITVRTSTPDTLLPPQGTRMTPCWAASSILARPPAFRLPRPAECPPRACSLAL